jgi:hypothetical protein
MRLASEIARGNGLTPSHHPSEKGYFARLGLGTLASTGVAVQGAEER